MSVRAPVRSPEWKRAIVVGASSGIGEQIARQLVLDGCKVVGVARRADVLDHLGGQIGQNFLPLAHDVTDYAGALDVFTGACDWLGGLDLIVYAAGAMHPVGLSEFEFEKDREMVEVNLLGAMAWLNLAAQRFEGAGRGTIIAVGSVAGDRGRAGQPGYNASKAGLATYMEALRNRLTTEGVVVSTVKPGPVATPMTEKAGAKPKMTAKQAAQLILKKGRKPGEHYLRWTHRLAFAIIRAIPGNLFRRLPIK